VTVFPPTEKLKDVGLQAPKPVQHPLHPVPAPHHTVPSLISSHGIFSLPGSSATTALLIQRTNEEEKWLARQRRLRQEKEDRQSQVSEFRQQVLEQHLDLGRPLVPTEAEHRPESTRWVLGGASREASDAGAKVCLSVLLLLVPWPASSSVPLQPSASVLTFRIQISLSSLLLHAEKSNTWKYPGCPSLALHTSHSCREATLRPR
jgi:hypothetical protein